MIRVLIEMEIPQDAYGEHLSEDEAVVWELEHGLRDIDPAYVTRHEVSVA